MRKYKPATLGVSMFDVITETTPGRVDPRTGELIESTAVPSRERKGIFDWAEVTAGRVDPRTGRLVKPRKGSKRDLEPARERLVDRRRMPDYDERPYPRMREGYYAGPSYMSGPGKSSSIFYDPMTWIIGSFAVVLGLEAFGVTHLFPKGEPNA